MQINNLLLGYPIIAIIELYHYYGHIICCNDSLDASGKRHYVLLGIHHFLSHMQNTIILIDLSKVDIERFHQ